jgi:metallo-beta-lactamase family protein
VNLRFLGAARQVTGSKYLLEADGRRFLVDCGLYQERLFLDRNWEPFPIPPETIEAILLTHAHLDHAGFIPRFVSQGFEGRILATAATVELARIVLLDSAHIQEEDAASKKRRHEREGRRALHPEIPLYTVADVERALPLFEPVAYGKPVALAGKLSVLFHDAGHILGSAMLDIRSGEKEGARRLVFSGDIGQWDRPLVRDPSVFDRADYVIMESTYGDRDHEDEGTIEDLLAEIIASTAARGGNVVVPVFAMERAQELLYYLGKLAREGRLPRLPVILDSPMAVDVTRVFHRYPSYLDEEAKALIRSGRSPFEFPGLRLTPSVEDSKSVNTLPGPAVILAGSGMATGGRIKHHLRRNLGRPEATVLFVGYQASNTLGRQIVDGAPEVRIAGAMVPVRARIRRVNGFSGHADHDGLKRWLAAFAAPPRKLFVCHGEETASLRLAAEMAAEGWPVTVPFYGDAFELE